MLITADWAATRFRMPAVGSLIGMPFGGVVACTTAHSAASSAYTDTRNDAQAGANAWSPPV